jgi:hypothetical protein
MGRKLCEASLEVERLGARVLFRRDRLSARKGSLIMRQKLIDQVTVVRGACRAGGRPRGRFRAMIAPRAKI